MSETKARLAAQVERMRRIVSVAAGLLDHVDDLLENGCEIEARHFDELRAAIYGEAKPKDGKS